MVSLKDVCNQNMVVGKGSVSLWPECEQRFEPCRPLYSIGVGTYPPSGMWTQCLWNAPERTTNLVLHLYLQLLPYVRTVHKTIIIRPAIRLSTFFPEETLPTAWALLMKRGTSVTVAQAIVQAEEEETGENQRKFPGILWRCFREESIKRRKKTFDPL